MPTTNPVPSTDPSDLLFNAGKLDEVVNGTANSFTDRLGVVRRTVAGMNADFDAQLADAESDLNVYRADAAASAAEALGYLQTIRTTSYGAYASDPATDPLGNPPTVGDEYFNTTANLLKRWNGTTWQASDINTANLAAPSGSALVGYDGGTVQDVLDGAKSLQDYAALRAYTGRAKRVYITALLVTAKPAGIAGIFQHDQTDTTSLDNGGTVIVGADGRRWKRDYSGQVDVMWFGATGLGSADETVNMQKAINATPIGGELYCQTGTFMIKATGDNASGTDGGLIISKSIKFTMAPGATLKAITGNKDQSYIIHVKDTTNVEISGGNLIGDRDTNTNTSEWGHGIYTWRSSNIYIHDISISRTKGDGIQFASNEDYTENFILENVVVDGARRWGVAFTAGSNVTFRNVTVKNHATGLGFGGGMDFEDQYNTGFFKNITIENCKFINNTSDNGAFVLQGKCDNLNIVDNVFDNNNTPLNLTGSAIDSVKINKNTFKNISVAGSSAITLRGNATAGSYAKKVFITENYFSLGGVNRALYFGGNALEEISYVFFESNIVENASPSTAVAGIYPGPGTIRNIYVKNNKFLGGFVINPTGIQNLDIVNNSIETSVSPALAISTSKCKVAGNRIIASGDDGIRVTAANVSVTDNIVVGAKRWCIYVPVDGTGTLVQGNFIDVSSGLLAIYAPAPTGAKSFFMNNVAFAPVGAAYSINAGHVSVNNQSA